MPAEHQGVWLRVEGRGSRVEGRGSRVEGRGFRVESVGFGVEGVGFRRRVHGAPVESSSSGSASGHGTWSRVLGSGFNDYILLCIFYVLSFTVEGQGLRVEG